MLAFALKTQDMFMQSTLDMHDVSHTWFIEFLTYCTYTYAHTCTHTHTRTCTHTHTYIDSRPMLLCRQAYAPLWANTFTRENQLVYTSFQMRKLSVCNTRYDYKCKQFQFQITGVLTVYMCTPGSNTLAPLTSLNSQAPPLLPYSIHSVSSIMYFLTLQIPKGEVGVVEASLCIPQVLRLE